MDLKHKILNPYEPLVFFEMVPPAAEKTGAMETAIEEAAKVRDLVDAINLPEIHDENRSEARTVKFVPRIEPRHLGAQIHRDLGAEVIVNRCVVYDADPAAWFRESKEAYGVRHVVMVGGESSQILYPGPSVTGAAERLRAAGFDFTLGGITIPSRHQEADRVRRKAAAGLSFFTTQVLFDSNDIVWLLQRLNGLEARIFLSFAPVSHPRDIQFLRWLGADIPADLDRFLLAGDATGSSSAYAARSLDLCRRILMDVFDNLPPDPPLIGLNIEHINKRNFAPAVQMVEKLGGLYRDLVSARVRAGLG
ncbi:MAG: hypothetical protein KGM47_13185 [Acidobacteriota bacterium]|nr:hypothetical protein [Acidobacteriota bacterium]